MTTPAIIEFTGENLLWGNLGKIAVIVSIFSALFASIGFYFHQRHDDIVWRKQAKIALYTHVVSVLSITAILFWIILNHYYEYSYAYEHSSNELPKYYMISCFWEGQEGSFLLWMFWHAILSLVLVRQRSELTSGALSVLTLAQFMLGTMLLGITIGDFNIGSSPFALLRDKTPDLLQIPILQSIGMENYLQIIKDGTGLNPLLQNYWMVIHPPTLFLGFASTIIPFGFVIAHFWNKKKSKSPTDQELNTRDISTNWIRQALPWTLFTVMILGAGIIMGGFWAYESLSFGGYWAWDPVENASLMPWIVLIAAVHILLITKNTGRYTVLGMILLCFSFFLVLYATFLTRSGVLGDASVHSFTDLGLSGQLLLFMFLFIVLTVYSTFNSLKSKTGIILIIISMFGIYFLIPSHISQTINTALFFACITWWVIELNKQYQVKNNEDHLWSREFWMFIGALVLLLSAFQIIFYTSTPVFNKLFGSTLAVQKPEFYNRYQLPFAIIITILTAFGQYFYYRMTDKKKVLKNILSTVVIALLVTIPLIYFFRIYAPHYIILLLASTYTIAGNSYFLLVILKGKIKLGGASIAHAGFGLMMMGVLVSSVNKNVLSFNNINQNYTSYEQETDGDFHDDKEQDKKKKIDEFNRENMLMVKHKKVQLGEFNATYDSSYTIGPDQFFVVKWERLGSDSAEIKENFTLKPYAQNNPQMGLISNPDTRHYLTRDIFTHVNYHSGMDEPEEFKNFQLDTVEPGQTFTSSSGLRKITFLELVPEKSEDESLFRISATLEVSSLNEPQIISPEFQINAATNQISRKDAISDQNGLTVSFHELLINHVPPKIVFRTGERRPKMDYIILKAVEFPWINLLWSGTMILVIGFTISIFQQVKENKKWRKAA